MPEAFKKNLEVLLIGRRYVGTYAYVISCYITYAILSLNLSPSYPLFCMLSHELSDWFTYSKFFAMFTSTRSISLVRCCPLKECLSLKKILASIACSFSVTNTSNIVLNCY